MNCLITEIFYNQHRGEDLYVTYQKTLSEDIVNINDNGSIELSEDDKKSIFPNSNEVLIYARN
jgi:hypothetical protein